jgi:hypothetical protein
VSGAMIWPDGLFRGKFPVLDIDRRPGISFSREGWYRFQSEREGPPCCVKKQIP